MKDVNILSELESLDIIRNLTDLEKLSLSLDQSQEYDSSILKELKNLKKLSLTRISGAYENLPESSNLKELRINECGVNDIEKIGSMYTDLEWLNVDYNPLENVTVEDIINIRNKMKNSEFRISFDNSKLAEQLKQTKIEPEDEKLKKELNEFIFSFNKDKEVTLFDIAEANIYKKARIKSMSLFNIIMELREKGLFLPSEMKLEVENIDEIDEKYLADIPKYVKKINFKNLTGITSKKLEKIGEDIIYEIEGDLKNSETAYTKDEILQVVDIMEQIKSKIPEDADEYSKFMKIYEIIGKAANYDRSGCMGTDEYIEGAEKLTRSLYGVLVEGRAVCVGYALALEYCLKYNGITAKQVGGYAYDDPNKGHAWNQVMINGKWYNTDLTWDRRAIQYGEKLEYCLVGDEEFYKDHTAGSKKDVNECKENFKLNYISQKNNDQNQYGKGVLALFSMDEYKSIAEDTLIKDNIIEELKRVKDEQKEKDSKTEER